MPHARAADVPIEHRAAYSLAEVAGLTGLSISGLYVLISRGQLQSVRVGGRRLVRREDLDAFLSGRAPAAKSCPPPRRKAPSKEKNRARRHPVSAADIAVALGEARREGRGWRCRCPLHNGRSLGAPRR